MRLPTVKNQHMALLAAFLATLGIILMVFGQPVGGAPLVPDGSDMTAIKQLAPSVSTRETNQSFTVTGDTNQVITVSPSGIVSVTRNTSTRTVQVTEPAADAPVDATPPATTPDTSPLTTPPNDNTITPDPTPTPPATPVCAPCGGSSTTAFDGHHYECPMVCVQ